MSQLSIYRPGTPITLQATVEIDDKTVFIKRLMAEHFIQAQFYTASVLPIQIGDFVIFNGRNYYINRVPNIVKISSLSYEYRIDFESYESDLKKKLFISSDGLADFSLSGSAFDFISLIVANVNQIGSGWSIGVVDLTNEVTMTFSNEYCSAVLSRIAEQFKLEYEISGKSINLVHKVGNATAYSFEYGKNQGFYKLERQQVSDQNILTKVYGFGGTKNIPEDYRGRAKRLVFNSKFLTANTALYGTIEGQFTDDMIYPQRTSTLTGANIEFNAGDGTDMNNRTSYVADSALDFDLNSYLIPGQVATIVFKSGDLSGIECEIWKYDHATKRMYISPYIDSDGYTAPSFNGGSPIQPVIGDSYTLVNIAMPQSYIDTAEAELEAATQTFLNENCVPQVVYVADIDPKYAKTNSISLDAGDTVGIVDTDLGINSTIRVSGVEYPLINPYAIKIVIAEFVPYTLQERIIQTTVAAKKEVLNIDRRNLELIRRNVVRMDQLKTLIFDTDGYFDSANINPLTIETSFISVGARSRNFALVGVVIEPNYLADVNALKVSAGILHHYSITSPIGTWTMTPDALFENLVSATPYYLYAKCSKSTPVGIWDLSSAQKAADGTDGYYYFLTGILYAVYNGARDYDFMNGMTYINGRTITTGRIRSIDGLNYFDLDQNQFFIGDSTHSLDWNVTQANTLTLKGALVQSPGGTTVPIPVFRDDYDPAATYFYGEQVIYNSSTWIYINNSPTSGHAPTEPSVYWKKLSSMGTPGQDGADGISIIFQGEFPDVASLVAAKGALQDGWSYRNTTVVPRTTYVYYAPNWFTVSADGLSIQHHGDAAVPDPSWAILNHTYRNTSETPAKIYIYNGSIWTLMLSDGSNGTDGANGTNGWNVYITYHNNPISSQPATPTGDGTTGGWHTASSVSSNWMSQKVAASASSGTWGTPICITGADGINGTDGSNGLSIFITYNDNPAESTPSNPTGDGTTGGWHTAPSSGSVWISQKVAASASAGSWGTPIRIKGVDGSNGSNGVNGLSIIWHGDAVAPDPSWAILNHTYRDTDDGIVYIYNGSAWVIMTRDGNDGVNGTNGTNAYLHIAWANDELGTDFSTSVSAGKAYMGTYTDSTQADSQIYSQYKWVLIKGLTGATGPMMRLVGVFSALVAYKNNSTIRDVVKYGDSYYLFKGTDNTSGAWNANNWESFGSSWTSLATGLLLAEMSTIENLYTQFFHSIAVPIGDLAGAVTTAVANVSSPISQSDMVTKNSTPGDAEISYGGHTTTMPWQTDAATTVSNYVATYAFFWNGYGVTLTNSGAARMNFSGPAGVAMTPAAITAGLGTAWVDTQAVPVTAQIDQILFSGSSGQGDVTIQGILKTINWTDGTLPNTISSFIEAYYDTYYAAGARIYLQDTDKLMAQSTTAGVPLSATSFQHNPNSYRGAIKIQGNDIWENEEANSTYGSISVNRRGYKGGDLYYRDFFIGNGKGAMIADFIGNANGNSIRLFGQRITMDNIPTSAAAANTGEVYRDGAGSGAILKIK